MFNLTSNWRAQNDLETELIEQGIVGIQGVDTRAITRHLRDRGAMRVGIFSGLDLSREEMVVEVRKADAMAGAYLVRDVSMPACYVVSAIGEKKFTIAALYFVLKSATPTSLAERVVEVHVMLYNTTFEQIMSIKPD